MQKEKTIYPMTTRITPFLFLIFFPLQKNTLFLFRNGVYVNPFPYTSLKRVRGCSERTSPVLDRVYPTVSKKSRAGRRSNP